MAWKDDLDALGTLESNLDKRRPLKAVLQEVLAASSKVSVWENKPMAYAKTIFKDGAVDSYLVSYNAGDIAQLAHELTHVAVNEKYKRDYINYANEGKTPPERTFSDDGKTCTNEEDRKRLLADKAAGDWLGRNLENLQGWTKVAGMNAFAYDAKIDAKLIYGRTNIHWEYDTVINQIMVWLVQWGYPQDPAALQAGWPPPAQLSNADKLFLYLEKALEDAYDRRTNDEDIQPANGPVVTAAPIAAVTISAPAVPNRRCYLSSACTAAMGMPDDCPELMTLRCFRDDYLRHRHGGEAMIAEYYATAPRLLDEIERDPDARRIYRQIYGTIVTCVDLIHQRRPEDALSIYAELFQRLKRQYAS